MLFCSYLFILVFLPVTLGVYLLILRQGWRKRSFDWLVVASLFFYGWWKWSNLPLLLGSLLFNYAVGTWLGKMEGGVRAKVVLTIGLTANLLFLGYFKYANFFIENADALFGLGWTFTHVVLPLGISFWTFQKIAYLVDSYNGLTRGYGFRDFCLFVSFFPQLIAGPIVHHSEMMPQFVKPRTDRSHWDDLAVGLGIFCIGLFKKIIIADALSGHVARIFDAAAAGKGLHAPDAWAGTLSFAFQVYFDFSGYSDMAIGLARMFGIILPLNFNSPYKAVSIVDFWRRWHMTLARFLSDYVYMPLTFSRFLQSLVPLGGKGRANLWRYMTLIVTMGLAGLWHGAAWTFVMWGLFHGVCLAVNHLWRAFKQHRSLPSLLPPGATQWVARAFTFFLMVLSCAFFRAATLRSACHVLATMFGLGMAPAAGAPLLLRPESWFWLAGLLAFVWFLPNSLEIFSRDQPYPQVVTPKSAASAWWLWRPNLSWALLLGAVMVWVILNLSQPSEFIYWQF